MPGVHATHAPSDAARWMNCAGAIAATWDIPDEPSEYAAEGSAAHEVAKWCLRQDKDAAEFIGTEIEVDGFKFTVDDEMASFVQVYVDQIRQRPGEKMIEEIFDLSEVYGVENQFGTGDAVIFNTDEDMLESRDLKFGRGVQVFAEGNPQGLSYAAGALLAFDMVWDWKKILIAIHQPRLDHYDEWIITREELEAWMVTAKAAAQKSNALLVESKEVIMQNLTAGVKQCQWCSLAGPNCPASNAFVDETVFDQFSDVSDLDVKPTRVQMEMNEAELANALDRLDLVSEWVSEVRAEGLRRANNGIVLPRWKLVAGKKGNRAFKDKGEAEKIMKGARLKSDQMYSKTLITPTAAGTLLKKLKKPKIWTKLEAIITQKDGKPGLAPESDKRPALAVAAQFEDVSGEEDFGDLL